MLTALRNGNSLLRGEDRFASRRQHGWCEDDQFFAEVYIEKSRVLRRVLRKG